MKNFRFLLFFTLIVLCFFLTSCASPRVMQSKILRNDKYLSSEDACNFLENDVSYISKNKTTGITVKYVFAKIKNQQVHSFIDPLLKWRIEKNEIIVCSISVSNPKTKEIDFEVLYTGENKRKTIKRKGGNNEEAIYIFYSKRIRKNEHSMRITVLSEGRKIFETRKLEYTY